MPDFSESSIFEVEKQYTKLRVSLLEEDRLLELESIRARLQDDAAAQIVIATKRRAIYEQIAALNSKFESIVKAYSSWRVIRFEPSTRVARVAVVDSALGFTFSHIWTFTGYLFTKQTREKIWAPVIEEMKVDYADARRRHRTKWGRRGLRVLFGIQTISHFIGTLRASVGGWFWALILGKVMKWLL